MDCLSPQLRTLFDDAVAPVRNLPMEKICSHRPLGTACGGCMNDHLDTCLSRMYKMASRVKLPKEDVRTLESEIISDLGLGKLFTQNVRSHV